ncbi:GNAT family N-acetyltransferase [Mycobacterium sp. THU-M104]|uniref:GNAT family N-acetyltransferase n=1 Tax=Mycobacterium sp. THU-M104 TaxID=3410515 RepID=UPI003B9B3F3D
MESLTPVVSPAAAESVGELAAVAARTFSLACPPSVPPDSVAAFIGANLSAGRFATYLADPRRAVLTARQDDRIIGYAMLVRGVSDDAGVQQAVDIRPAAELSKMYVLAEYHGTGAAAALMTRALDTAERWGARCVWLGVNQNNERAQRFYAKSGFRVAGSRTFQVGARREDDYVMIRRTR